MQAVVQLAKKHQSDGDLQPLSMATLFTPAGAQPSAEEMVFRRRAIELGKQASSDVGCEDVIVAIFKKLVSEGLYCAHAEIDEEMVDILNSQISQDRSEERTKILRIYHYLMWKTAGDQKWTLRRNPGECNTITYLPHILLGNHMKMEAETVFCMRKAQLDAEDLSSVLIRAIVNADESSSENAKSEFKPEDWVEVSLIEFINGCLPGEQRLTEHRSQPITQVITSKERKLTWKDAQDSDNHRGEVLFESQAEEEEELERKYVRTKFDVRILYEMRPLRMKNMVLGEFASKYRRIKPGGNGLQAAKDKIDPETGLGPDSSDKLVGENHLMAPRCMQLTNEDVMVKRSGKNAVLHLLYDGKARRHGNQLLWSPWQFLEEIKDQDQDETEEQRRRRHEVFPMSKEEQDEDSD